MSSRRSPSLVGSDADPGSRVSAPPRLAEPTTAPLIFGEPSGLTLLRYARRPVCDRSEIASAGMHDQGRRPALLCYDGSDYARRAIEQAAAVLDCGPAVVLTVWESIGPALRHPIPAVAEFGREFVRETISGMRKSKAVAGPCAWTSRPRPGCEPPRSWPATAPRGRRRAFAARRSGGGGSRGANRSRSSDRPGSSPAAGRRCCSCCGSGRSCLRRAGRWPG
jgi:hypothetical protein